LATSLRVIKVLPFYSDAWSVFLSS
jgi:hypothetical protein